MRHRKTRSEFYISKNSFFIHSFCGGWKKGNKKWDNWNFVDTRWWALLCLEWRSYDHDKTGRGRKRRKIRWFLEKQFGTKNCTKKDHREGEKLRKIFHRQRNAIENRNINKFIYSTRWMKKTKRMEKIRINIDHLMIMECKMSFLKCFLLLAPSMNKNFLLYFSFFFLIPCFHSWNQRDVRSILEQSEV